MSRHGWTESDGEDQWAEIRQAGAMKSALRGKRGQKLLRDLVAALDAMPVKELVPDSFSCDGGVCALGAVAQYRGVEVPRTVEVIEDEFGTIPIFEFEGDRFEEDEYDLGEIAAGQLDISSTLAREVMWQNDECYDTPAQRWAGMRRWAERRLKPCSTH